VAEEIDKEVRGLVEEAYKRAREIVRVYRSKLDGDCQRLMDKETVDASEFQAMFG